MLYDIFADYYAMMSLCCRHIICRATLIRRFATPLAADGRRRFVLMPLRYA